MNSVPYKQPFMIILENGVGESKFQRAVAEVATVEFQEKFNVIVNDVYKSVASTQLSLVPSPPCSAMFCYILSTVFGSPLGKDSGTKLCSR